ncbi:hypothetical protein J6590_068919 [Homalodisca vitripennis]|nr:hypothetical protein J6590_068919 [Homalodisca vitripennis]
MSGIKRVKICPLCFRSNAAQVHRLVPFLNRELNVLCGTTDVHVQHVLSRILELITQVPIRSPGFAAAIAPYIGRHTEHFVHEFYSFASAPYDLIGYDRAANYVTQASLAHEITSELSDSGADSDVQVAVLHRECIQTKRRYQRRQGKPDADELEAKHKEAQLSKKQVMG